MIQWIATALAVVCFVAYLIEHYHRIEYQKQFLEKSEQCEKYKKRANCYYNIWCFVNANLPRCNDFTVDLWHEEDNFYSVTYRFDYEGDTYSIDVKRFYFDPINNDSQHYARNCAEEVCDKLNEQI